MGLMQWSFGLFPLENSSTYRATEFQKVQSILMGARGEGSSLNSSTLLFGNTRQNFLPFSLSFFKRHNRTDLPEQWLDHY